MSHKPKHNQKTQQSTWAAAALSLSGFALYCHGNIRHAPNSWICGSLWVRSRCTALGLLLPLSVPLFGPPEKVAWTNREMHVLQPRWPPVSRKTQQPTKSSRHWQGGGGYVRGDARGMERVLEGRRLIILVVKLIDKKTKKISHLGIRQPPSNNSTHNNQPQIGQMRRSYRYRVKRWGMSGGKHGGDALLLFRRSSRRDRWKKLKYNCWVHKLIFFLTSWHD